MSILTRWEPFRELRHEMRQMRRFQRAMDRLFGRWGSELPERPALAVSYPPVNLWEDDDFVYAEAELPGLKLPDLEITVAAGNQPCEQEGRNQGEGRRAPGRIPVLRVNDSSYRDRQGQHRRSLSQRRVDRDDSQDQGGS